MENFDQLRKICDKNSRLSERVVDDFLMGYAAGHRNMEKEMDRQFDRYRHVTSLFDPGQVMMLKGQYLVHRVFREDGLIHQLMKLPALQRFKGEERRYLEQQIEVPWRFSFSEVVETPAKEFFRMRDIFSGLEYLLFSPGMEQLRASGSPLLFLNLIGFNGACWQSYGPIGAYASFQPGDIWFFATEVNPEIGSEEEAAADIWQNPIPYMMLLSGAAYPLTFHKEDQVVYTLAEYDLERLDTAVVKSKFKSEYDSGIYRFSHKQWGEHPHFAHAYFDEKEGLILLTAMTDRGFQKLADEFNRFGFSFETTPFLRVNVQMVVTAEKILKRRPVLNEYEELFQEESDPETKEAVDKMNAFMSLVMPDLNEGRDPDIEAAAKKTGVHIDTAQDLVRIFREKQEEIPDRREGQKEADREEAERFRELYSLAEEIRQEEPWTYMEETDLFGVRIPGTDRIYFVSVMGSGGEYTALSAYKGYAGLGELFEYHESDGRYGSEWIFTIPHLMVAFTDREEIDTENKDAIKKAGLKFRGRGRWPALREITPGYLPAFPGDEALADLAVVLEQASEVIRRAGEDEDYLGEEPYLNETFLIRTPSGKPGRVRWTDRYERFEPEKGSRRYRMTYRKDSISAVSRLSVSPVTLQADLVMLPSPVGERGSQGYFPFVLLLVDKENGMVAGMEMLTPEPDLTSMYERVPEEMLKVLSKTGFRPEKIEIRSGLLFTLVDKALKAAWCRAVQVDELTPLDEAASSLIEHL